MPVATGCLTSTGGCPRADLSQRPHAPARSMASPGALARDPVRFQNVGDVIDVPGPGLEHLGDDLGDRRATGSGPSRNASTATSLAPLSTAGAPPPARPGRVGEPQAREGLEVGRLEGERAQRASSRWPRTPGRAGPARRARGRSAGACRACESWAMVAPSPNSTIPCTIDCGCTTTSIRSKSTPNSSCASITSRPLFIRVDESMVILAPMPQVGWLERVGDGDLARAAPGCGPGTARRWR